MSISIPIDSTNVAPEREREREREREKERERERERRCLFSLVCLLIFPLTQTV